MTGWSCHSDRNRFSVIWFWSTFTRYITHPVIGSPQRRVSFVFIPCPLLWCFTLTMSHFDYIPPRLYHAVCIHASLLTFHCSLRESSSTVPVCFSGRPTRVEVHVHWLSHTGRTHSHWGQSLFKLNPCHDVTPDTTDKKRSQSCSHLSVWTHDRFVVQTKLTKLISNYAQYCWDCSRTHSPVKFNLWLAVVYVAVIVRPNLNVLLNIDYTVVKHIIKTHILNAVDVYYGDYLD